MARYIPGYVRAYEAGWLQERVEAALELLKLPCRVCPRYCKVNRADDERGACLIGRYAVVARQYYPANKVGEAYPEINRLVYREEYLEALEYAESLGLRLDRRSVREGLLLPSGAKRGLQIINR
jgi:uncharacterized Fe-S radical SAM superfamily protein PflX